MTRTTPADRRFLASFCLAQAVCVLVIVGAYALSRQQSHYANKVYWIGAIAFIVLPFVIAARSRVTTAGGAVAALNVAVAALAVRFSYAPGQFRFLDEYQHLGTLSTLLDHNHLFLPNAALPVSPEYPGLEIVVSTVVQVTGLPQAAAAFLVLAVARVLTVLGLYELMRLISGSPKLALLACLVYAAGPHFLFFDAYLTYTAVALPMAVWACVAAVRQLLSPSGAVAVRWAAICLALSAATIVCHHVTSYALTVMLIVIFADRGRARIHLLTMFVYVAVLALWNLVVAKQTVRYFAPVVDQIIRPPADSAAKQIVTVGAPKYESYLSQLGAVVLLLVTIVGYLHLTDRIRFWRLLRVPRHLPRLSRLWHGAAVERPAPSGAQVLLRTRERLARRILLISPVAVVGTIGARAVLSDGAELAGRAWAYVLVPASLAVAYGARWAWRVRYRVPRGRLTVSVAGAVAVAAITAMGITAGWPPAYARLPGPYLPGAWERSVDQNVVAAGRWAAEHLPPRSYVASDQMLGGVYSGLAGPDGSYLSAFSYAVIGAPAFDDATRQILQANSIGYALVDSRLAQSAPPSGTLFGTDPTGEVRLTPLPAAAVQKFSTDPRSICLYTAGSISVYDLRALWPANGPANG